MGCHYRIGMSKGPACCRSEDPAIAASFAADEDGARQLARLLSHSVEWQPMAGSEAMTANAVNQILINVLQGIDWCADFDFARTYVPMAWSVDFTHYVMSHACTYFESFTSMTWRTTTQTQEIRTHWSAVMHPYSKLRDNRTWSRDICMHPHEALC